MSSSFVVVCVECERRRVMSALLFCSRGSETEKARKREMKKDVVYIGWIMGAEDECIPTQNVHRPNASLIINSGHVRV